MAITISGSGITSANIADGTIVNADVNDVAASKLTGALPAIDGSSLTNLPGGGKVLQVVTGAAQSSRVTFSSTTFADTGLTVDITPSATSSKILVIASGDSWIQGTGWNAYLEIRLMRDSTEISRVRNAYDSGNSTFGARLTNAHTLSILDSPSTTSAVTYKVQGALQGTLYNAVGYIPGRDSADHLKNCTIIAMEIGA